jgi:hypothetical protein
MLAPDLLLKMRGVVAAKKAAVAAVEAAHSSVDSRVREAVSEL